MQTKEKTDTVEQLQKFWKNGFDSDIEAAALALGREPEEIRAMLDNELLIDEDMVMKMRGIAQERNFDI